MKLKNAVLMEVSIPVNYNDYVKEMNAAIDKNDYNQLRALIKSTFSKKKYDWFGMWYSSVDREGTATKGLLRALNF